MASRELRTKQANILLKTSKAISEAGAPAHRLESYMQILLEKFDLSGSFFAMPTAILASIGEIDNQRTFMVKTNPGDINLGILQKINDVINKLENNQIDIDEALDSINQISKQESEFPIWLTILSFGLVSAGFTSLFAGSWHDVLSSALVGWVTGIITIFANRHKHLSQLVAPLVAMVIGFISISISYYFQNIDHFLVSLAGLIILVPGLGITVAMRELSTNHLVSGSSRMAGAVTTLFLLSFGLALGYLLAEAIYGEIAVNKLVATPDWFNYSALIVTALAFTVLFKSRIKDTFWIFISITLAYTGSTIFGIWIDQPFKSLVTVMLIAVTGNIYARISNNPASLMHIPGIILLVPGSIGFHSLSAMYTNNTMTGIQAAFDAMLIAISISIGLLVGNLIVPPKKDL